MDILSKETDVIGTDKYRDNTPGIAMAYRPTTFHTVSESSNGKNHPVTVKTNSPVIQTVAGVSVSDDAFLMVTKFSALQHIENDVQRAKTYDDHVAFLVASRDTNLYGTLPKVPIVIV